MGLSPSQLAQIRLQVQDMMGDGEIVGVETYLGESAYGPIYAASTTCMCNIGTTLQVGTKLVRNKAGEEVILQATLQVAPADESKFTPESRVTISGRTSTALSVTRMTFKGELVYVEVGCG